MLIHPQFDPIALSIGPLAIRWYGLMYLIGFILFLVLGKYRAQRYPERGFTTQNLDDILFYGVLGVILGGRLGYVLFYKPAFFLAHPLEIFALWHGGMSFHGGFLGVLVAMLLFARKHGKSWLAVIDFGVPMVPPGLAMGRLGNFINAELPGRVTDVPWAMIFPNVDMLPRHPSQLYQFALEGVALFFLIWWYSAKPRPPGAVIGFFLAGYGVFRFIAEFGREPDDFLGLLAMNLSMGQWLSFPMIVVGVGLLYWAHARTKV